jgi:hypothetical protein
MHPNMMTCYIAVSHLLGTSPRPALRYCEDAYPLSGGDETHRDLALSR